MIIGGIALLALALNPSPTPDDPPPTPDAAAPLDAEPTELDGTYAILSGEKNGAAIPAEHIDGNLVRFEKDRVIVFDRDQKEVYAATFRLNTKEKPWRITLTSKTEGEDGATAQGLIEKEGETVRLIYALPGGEAPTEFKTREKQLLFTLKRAEAAEAKAP